MEHLLLRYMYVNTAVLVFLKKEGKPLDITMLKRYSIRIHLFER